MVFNFFRKEPGENPGGGINVVIISAACCIPGMKPFDDQAQRVIEQAITETGVEARVSVIPATTAYFGGAPKEVMARLMSDAESGRIGVPAVLIGGKAVSYGVPRLEDMKAALRGAASTVTAQGGTKGE